MKNSFILGTAQFGSSYGITNQLGQPSKQEIEEILDFSFEKGIEYLDTALSYGNSLEILSCYFKRNDHKKFKIVTKFSVLSDYDDIYNQLSSFLDKTSCDPFQTLFIHDTWKVDQVDQSKLQCFLNKVLKNNIAKNIGVSIYKPSEVKLKVADMPIQTIQCPINLFNQEFLFPDKMMLLKNKKVEIHARSVFLQGLLLSNKLPEKLIALAPHWQTYQKFINQSGISPLNLIVSWLKNHIMIDKWVIGVNTKKELVDILDEFNKLKPITGLNIGNLDISHHPLVDPRNW